MRVRGQGGKRIRLVVAWFDPGLNPDARDRTRMERMNGACGICGSVVWGGGNGDGGKKWDRNQPGEIGNMQKATHCEYMTHTDERTYTTACVWMRERGWGLKGEKALIGRNWTVRVRASFCAGQTQQLVLDAASGDCFASPRFFPVSLQSRCRTEYAMVAVLHWVLSATVKLL